METHLNIANLELKLRRGLAVIINDTDAPEPRMVAILHVFDLDNGRWFARYLGRRPLIATCTADNPTPIGMFGMRLEFDPLLRFFRCARIGPCRAIYGDGAPRAWQDRTSIKWHEVRARATAERARRALNLVITGAKGGR